MHPVDHAFVLLLVLAQPIHGAVTYRRYLRQIESGQPPDRIKLYRQTLVLEWLALAVLATAWLLLNRPVSYLGFVTPGGIRFYVGTILLALLCGFLAYQWRVATKMTADQRTRQIEALGDLVHMSPRNQREYRQFVGLSITAGIVEEIIYRGFVIWYLSQFMPLWGAVIASSIIFGLGHSYQGVAGMAQTGLAGLGSGALYVFTGSIWLPMIGHALVDLLQGKTLVTILKDSGEGEAGSTSQP